MAQKEGTSGKTTGSWSYHYTTVNILNKLTDDENHNWEDINELREDTKVQEDIL